MRDAPSLDVVPAMQEMGARVRAYDPAGMNEARQLFEGVDYAEGPYQALEGADAVVLLTEWDEFRALDLNRVKAQLNAPIMVDLRNIYRPDLMAERGFEYYSVGRPHQA